MSRNELAFLETPLPIAAEAPGKVHSRRCAEAENVLHWNERRVGDRGVKGPDEHPVDLELGIIEIETEVLRGELVLAAKVVGAARRVSDARSPPADHRVVVVSAGVSDDLARIIVRAE